MANGMKWAVPTAAVLTKLSSVPEGTGGLAAITLLAICNLLQFQCFEFFTVTGSSTFRTIIMCSSSWYLICIFVFSQELETLILASPLDFNSEKQLKCIKQRKRRWYIKKKYQWKQVSSQASDEQEHQAWFAELKRENTQKRKNKNKKWPVREVLENNSVAK